MARDRRRRGENPVVRYDNDATVIIETPATEEEKSVPVQRRRTVGNSMTLPLTDVIDTLVSYVSKTAWYEQELKEKPGVCSICKGQTKHKIRKICGNCMNKYSGEIYDLASDAVENGQTSITLNVVE